MPARPPTRLPTTPQSENQSAPASVGNQPPSEVPRNMPSQISVFTRSQKCLTIASPSSEHFTSRTFFSPKVKGHRRRCHRGVPVPDELKAGRLVHHLQAHFALVGVPVCAKQP